MVELESFVEQLERYFLEGGGDPVRLRGRLKDLRASAEKSENEGLVAVLEQLERHMYGGGSPVAEELMPIIFTLRSIVKETTGDQSDGDYVRIETPGRKSLFTSLSPYHRDLLRSARERGERLYQLSVNTPGSCRGPVIEAIERSCAVIQSDDSDDSGTLQFLIVSSEAPEPDDLLRGNLHAPCHTVECRMRHVSFEEVIEASPVSMQWYGGAPELPVGSSIDRIERTLILLNELRRSPDEGMDGIIGEIADGTTDALSSTVERVCEHFFPHIRTLGHELGKRVSIRVSGDVGRLSIVHAEMVGAALRELLENAIRHGIEPGEERLRRGKQRTGNIRIEVTEYAHSMGLRIRDDGKGVAQEELAAAFDRAGRHGLGWVRRIVEEYFGGRLTIRAGGGTTAELEIPRGDGMFRARPLRRRGETFVVPVAVSSENIVLKNAERSTEMSGGIHIHGGERGVLPLMDIGEDGTLRSCNSAANDAMYAVAVTAGSTARAVVADEIGREVMAVPLVGEPFTVRLGLRDEYARVIPLTSTRRNT